METCIRLEQAQIFSAAHIYQKTSKTINRKNFITIIIALFAIAAAADHKLTTEDAHDISQYAHADNAPAKTEGIIEQIQICGLYYNLDTDTKCAGVAQYGDEQSKYKGNIKSCNIIDGKKYVVR